MKAESTEVSGRLDPFVGALAVVCALLSVLPAILIASGPSGMVAVANAWATDDQMVYYAWMRQTQEFRFLMDNRFAFEEQPGLTINLYFSILGLISKALGMFWTSELVKAILAAASVFQIHRLIARLQLDPSVRRLALVLAIFGGGFGFLVWHLFGEAIIRPGPQWIADFTMGRLPMDVWQPEAFVFPSMLVNGLFLAALCLMIQVLISLLDSKTHMKAVWPGMLSMFLLANIHTYDVVILGAIALAFLVAMALQNQLTKQWFFRGAAIFAGAIPPGLWLAHVLSQDKVFQSRAATETYSPNIRLVVLGLGLLLLLGWVGISSLAARKGEKLPIAGIILHVVLMLILVLLSQSHLHTFFLPAVGFTTALILAMACSALVKFERHEFSLLAAWVFVSPIIIYLPTLFQRKLAMGMALPFGIFAAIAIAALVAKQTRTIRLAATGAATAVMCLGSLLWIGRQVGYASQDVSRTTVHPMRLSESDFALLAKHSPLLYGKRTLAMPGVPQTEIDGEGKAVPDRFVQPYLPDLSPYLSGICGAYSFAGHWSETPGYNGKRGQASAFFDASTTTETKIRFLRNNAIEFVLAPKPERFEQLQKAGLQDVRALGEVIGESENFSLIQIQVQRIEN